jgi:hypothetical protein
MCTRYVHVFMLFSLISMNKELNQSRFSRYPKAGPVPEAPVAPLPGPARRASARACGSPSSSYRLHKRCIRSPPFKSVEILLNSRYGIKPLIP